MISAETWLYGRHYRTAQPIRLRLAQGRIAELRTLDVAPGAIPWIAPGLFDMQINGFAGLDLNVPGLAPGTLQLLARRLWREGVTSFLPTIITAAPEQIGAAMAAIAAACEGDPLVAASIGGIHLEGPFLSPDDGPRGAHPRQHIRAPDWELFSHWQVQAGGRIRIVTLSPEWPEAEAFIERCVAHGTIAAIGHTAATPAQIRAAVARGAQLATHFGNGARLMMPRHPNELWEQLAADTLWASLIADGFHLPDAVLKVALRVKGQRAVLVSDAVALAGLAPGNYETAVGGRVVLTAEGRLHLAEQPELLAGAAQSLRAGVEHLLRGGLCPLAEAWEAASTRPATLLAHETAAGLSRGAPADLVLFDCDGQAISVRQVYKHGRLVAARSSAAL
jgi:N-acetylglucosamine-6-phosphate deacetylase